MSKDAVLGPIFSILADFGPNKNFSEKSNWATFLSCFATNFMQKIKNNGRAMLGIQICMGFDKKWVIFDISFFKVHLIG